MQEQKVQMNNEISAAMRKYQIGREYYRRWKEAEDRYIEAVKQKDETYLNTHKLNCKQAIATELGKEHHLSTRTILSYAAYADIIDEVETKNVKLVKQILSGETKMGYQELKRLMKVL